MSRATARPSQTINRNASTRRRNKAGTVDPPQDHRMKLETTSTPTLASAAASKHVPTHGLPPWDLEDSTPAVESKYESYEEDASPSRTYELRRRTATARMVPTKPEEDDDADDDDDDKHSECTRLKGVFWPGMDIFDSATPEMKRKRNQKKDTSVIEQLEVNSLEVEATEQIWSPAGTLQRSKVITGLASSSPFKLDPSPKKRRVNNHRPPLFDLSNNRPRRSQHNPFAMQFAMFQDQQTEMELTYGPRRRRQAFDVFQDQPEVSFGHPAPFSYLTSEFHYPNQPSSGLPTYDPTGYNDPFRFETQVDERGPYKVASYADEKENFDNMSYSQHGSYCATNTYPVNQFYQPMLPHEYAGLYANTHIQNGFHDYQPFPLRDEVEDEDENRTITATPSDA